MDAAGKQNEITMRTYTYFLENNENKVLVDIFFFGNDPSPVYREPHDARVAHCFASQAAAQLFLDANPYLANCHIVSTEDKRYWYTTSQFGAKDVADLT